MILDDSILGIVTDGEDVLILYLLDGALDDVAATLISIELRLSGATNTIRHTRSASIMLGFIVFLMVWKDTMMVCLMVILITRIQSHSVLSPSAKSWSEWFKLVLVSPGSETNILSDDLISPH